MLKIPQSVNYKIARSVSLESVKPHTVLRSRDSSVYVYSVLLLSVDVEYDLESVSSESSD